MGLRGIKTSLSYKLYVYLLKIWKSKQKLNREQVKTVNKNTTKFKTDEVKVTKKYGCITNKRRKGP